VFRLQQLPLIFATLHGGVIRLFFSTKIVGSCMSALVEVQLQQYLQS
jgi:hypothetical protein